MIPAITSSWLHLHAPPDAEVVSYRPAKYHLPQPHPGHPEIGVRMPKRRRTGEQDRVAERNKPPPF